MVDLSWWWLTSGGGGEEVLVLTSMRHAVIMYLFKMILSGIRHGVYQDGQCLSTDCTTASGRMHFKYHMIYCFARTQETTTLSRLSYG